MSRKHRPGEFSISGPSMGAIDALIGSGAIDDVFRQLYYYLGGKPDKPAPEVVKELESPCIDVEESAVKDPLGERLERAEERIADLTALLERRPGFYVVEYIHSITNPLIEKLADLTARLEQAETKKDA